MQEFCDTFAAARGGGFEYVEFRAGGEQQVQHVFAAPIKRMHDGGNSAPVPGRGQ